MTERESQVPPSKESEDQLDEEAEERFDDESLAPNSSSQDERAEHPNGDA